MARCDFSEKAYEIAYYAELAARAGSGLPLYAPSQVLEAILGFDMATDPGHRHPIWGVLRAPRPAGVRLLDAPLTLTPHAQASLPSHPVSLILQFKCPEYLRGARARQWQLWHQPYFRFTRTKHQQTILARLEDDLADQCIVRYAAPAFHRQYEFESAHFAGDIINRSGHVSPQELRKHRTWTFIEPGVDGRANPAGQPRPFATFDSVLDLTFTLADPDARPATGVVERFRGLSAHLDALATSLRYRNPNLRAAVDSWAATLGDLPLEPQVRLDLRNFAAIQTALLNMGARWNLVTQSQTR